MAQTSIETAISVVEGTNTYTLDGKESQSVFWQFTADKDYLAKVSPLANKYDLPSVMVKGTDGQYLTLSGAQAKYPNKVYALKKGETYFFEMRTVGERGFNFGLVECSDYGKGLTENDPLEVKLGEEQYFGDPLNTSQYGSSSIYATYTAQKSGQLQMAFSAYVSAEVNGVSSAAGYDQTTGGYTLKIAVEAGKTYKIKLSLSGSVVATSKVVEMKAGSMEMPFTMQEGENKVPAAMGDYYFAYTSTKVGFLNIKSDATIPGGQVKVYRSLSDMTQPVASSEVGSYDVRFEVPYAGSTYYVVVNKLQASDAEDVISASMEDYAPGETVSTAIKLTELPAEQTLPKAKGTFYYELSVPANTQKFVVVTTKKDLKAGTSILFYNKSNGTYGASTLSNGELKAFVGQGYDVTYLLQVTSDEDEALSFKIDYVTPEQGSLDSNPVEAKLGDNEITIDGDEYFSYKATKDGKLSVEVDPDVTVSFPGGTHGEYSVIKRGATFAIEAEKDKTYLIKVSGATKGSTMYLEEKDFAAGETRTTPIEMTGDEYTFTKEGASNLWLEYTAKENGVLDFACDAPYNGNSDYIEICKNEELGGSRMMGTETVGSETNTVYKGRISVMKGDKLYVHCMLSGTVTGKKVTFVQHEEQPGENVANPLVLEKGKSVVVSGASYNVPVWVKVELPAGDTQLNFNGYVSGYMYTSLEDAKADVNGTYMSSVPQYGENYTPIYDENGDQVYLWTQSMYQAGVAYFKFTSCNGTVKMTYKDVSTGINTIEAISDGKAAIYKADGTKVNQISGAGVYIIKQDGKTKKFIIRK